MVFRRWLCEFLKKLIMLFLVTYLLANILVLFFPSLELSNFFSMEIFINSFPHAVKKVFALGELDMGDAAMYSIRMTQVLYLTLCLYFLFSGAKGAGLRSGFAQFYLSAPITRRKYFLSIWGMGAMLAIFINLLLALASVCLMQLLNHDLQITMYAYIFAKCAAVHIAVYSIGLMMSAACRTRLGASVLSLLLFTVFFTFGAVGTLFMPLLTYGGLYHMAIPENIISSGMYFNMSEPILCAGVILMCAFIGMACFIKRDLPENDMP